MTSQLTADPISICEIFPISQDLEELLTIFRFDLSDQEGAAIEGLVSELKANAVPTRKKSGLKAFMSAAVASEDANTMVEFLKSLAEALQMTKQKARMEAEI